MEEVKFYLYIPVKQEETQAPLLIAMQPGVEVKIAR